MLASKTNVRVYFFEGGRCQSTETQAITETSVTLTVNGEDWLVFMCTPLEMEALAVGFLFNEGLIQSKAEIASVRVCPTGDTVDVWLNHGVDKPVQWRRTSGCTGGVTGVPAGTQSHEPPSPNPFPQTGEGENIGNLGVLGSEAAQNTQIPEFSPPSRPVFGGEKGGDAAQSRSGDEGGNQTYPKLIEDGVVLTPEMVITLVGQLFAAQELYQTTGGVHTSALSDGKRILMVAEDIGRHNTLDKIAGRCLLDGIKPLQKVLVTTGRVSSEMMQKAARIGASAVISRTAPSSLSIEIAERLGITLIGYARRDRFTVYCHPQRVVAGPDGEPACSETENMIETQA